MAAHNQYVKLVWVPLSVTREPILKVKSQGPVPSAAQLGHRHQLLNFLVERITLGDDFIDDAEG
jgi:hypothetical protein